MLFRSTAFLLHGILARTVYKNWLLLGSGFALIVAVAVSGSRSVVASVGLVLLSMLAILVVRPSAVNRIGRSVLLVVLIGWGISYLPIFKEGVAILEDRFTEAAEASDTTIAGGLLRRTYSGFVEGFRVFDRLPLFGYGLGIGTNGGAKFVTGRAGFLLAEGEWARVLLESGPILGLMFLCWRMALTVYLGWRSMRALVSGETLSVMLFSATFVTLLDGQFGQPTILGFAALVSGLCLASTNVESKSGLPGSSPALQLPSRPIPSRSAFAAQLHATENAGPKSNGSADR